MADMEAVNSFNAELQSLYDVKPPISKGKMTSLTRAALKAVKLYKHVVQSVEKFIQKCKAEYKIPGLYVIDSIIRQSRHQFGPEKDVFAQRFARNIQTTFVHLYRCPEEDKAKIIRVLNLWQKNKIFSPQVIQPLFDLADPSNPIWEQINSNINSDGGPQSNNVNNSSGAPSNLPLPPVHFNKKVLDFDYGDGDDDGGAGKEGNSQGGPSNSNSTNNLGGPLDALGSILNNPEILRQLQTIQEQMQAAAAASYSTPEQERLRKLAELSKQEAAFDQRLAETVARLPFAKDCELPLPQEGDQRGSDSVDQNSNQVGGNAGPSNVLLPPPFFQQLTEQQNQQQQQQQQQQNHQQQQLQNLFRNIQQGANAGVPAANPFGLPMPFPIQGVPPPQFPQEPQGGSSVPHHLFPGASQEAFFNHFANNIAPPNNHSQQQQQQQQQEHPQISISQKIYEEIDLCEEDSKEDGVGGRLAGERDRRGKRSRSQDRHDRSRGRRSRSRSRDKGRSKRSYRSRSRERAREEREKEKERQRKGLPSIKREHLSICSTTLWVGHLSKLVSQEEISDTFGAYGDIISIDLISPRGCAFIVMNRRQDAVRALDRLKNTKLQGKTITLAWAPGKGVKGKEWKDYWEVGDGVSYIPWNKLRDDINLEDFEDGGCIDEDTLPDFLKNKPKPPSDAKSLMPPLPPMDNDNSQDSNSVGAIPPPQPPLPPHPPSTAAQLMQGLVPGLPTGPHQPPPPSGIPSLLDPAALAAAGIGGKPPGDTDARDGPPPGMGPGPFGMGPPGMGMMPMGMNLMVPPPMLAAMGPGNPFQGMAGLPGMPPMMGIPGMVPAPGPLPVPPAPGQGPNMTHALAGLGGPGILGEMPHQGRNSSVQQQLNDSLMNASNDENAGDLMGNMGDGGIMSQGGKRGKKRSRFDDPEDKLSPSGDNSMDIGNMSPSQGTTMKDDRPVFERLKSLAEGYSFQNNDKAGGVAGSLLGTPPGVGGGPRPLLPNSFSPGLLGNRPPVRPLFGTPGGPQSRLQTPQSSWAGGFGENTENPFLNPNPSNPFTAAGGGANPFVTPAGNFSGSENPFEIVSNSQGNPFAAAAAGGFGSRRGNWQRGGDDWGGRGRGRGGRGGWRGGRGGWGGDQMEDHMGDEESRGFRGRGGGRGGRDSNSWGRGREERGESRPRSRDGDRGSGRRRSRSRSRGAGDDDRGNRRRRNSSENNGERRRHRSGEDRRDSGRHDRRRERERGGWGGDRHQNQHSNHTQQQAQAPEEENWDDGMQTAGVSGSEPIGVCGGDIHENNEALAAAPAGDSWEDDGPPGEEKGSSHHEGDVQDHHLSTSNTNEDEHWDTSSRDAPAEEQHPNHEEEDDQYGRDRQEEEEYPAQEQEYGDDYQPQEEENEYQEEDDQNQQNHDKTDEYEGEESYTNADYNGEPDGGDNEVYDNGDGGVYENTEDFTNNYNNENEENYDNEREEYYDNDRAGDEEDYQCNNSGGDDSHVMPDSSSSYTQNNGESEEASVGGKCTSSLEEKPSEELNNSIAS